MRITIEHLVKRFGTTEVIRDVSLQVDSGAMVTLLGASGSGKTTLLRMVAGLERPDAGRILFDDRVVDDPAAGVFVPPRERRLGMVFQSYALWPHRDVHGNLDLALRERGMAPAEIEARVANALRQVGLEGLGQRAIHQLSGGQQQRVALARALVAEPALLLFDEPLSNLDAALREQMRGEIRALQQRLGITALFVTHDQAEALALSDRIAVLDRGRVAQLDTPEGLYLQPTSAMTAQFMGHANLLPGRAEAGGMRVAGVLLVLETPVPAGSAALMIRPEALRFVAADSAGVNTLDGEIEQAELLGPLRSYRVRVPALDAALTVFELSARAPRTGAVRVELPPAQLRALGQPA
jgi:iron(III) transport system ATP-binding protein